MLHPLFFMRHPSKRGRGTRIEAISSRLFTCSIQGFSSRFQPGDVILSLNNCSCRGESGWLHCILSLLQHKNSSVGFCVSKDLLASPAHLDTNSICFKTTSSQSETVCLNGRNAADNKFCSTDMDCDSEHVCVQPISKPEEAFVKIAVQDKPFVLFIGSAADLWQSLAVTSYQPRWEVLNNGLFLSLPYIFENLLRYLSSFSAALALLNMVPAYFLDGQWAFAAVLDCFTSTDAAWKRTCCTCVYTLSSILLFINIAMFLI